MKDDTLSRAIGIYFSNFTARSENAERKEERRSLKKKRRGEREREILLLTLVFQLNPLVDAINILVMMSDEPPRERRTQWITRGRAAFE